MSAVTAPEYLVIVSLFDLGHGGDYRFGSGARAGHHDLAARARGLGGAGVGNAALFLLAFNLGGKGFALGDGAVGDEQRRRG